MLFHVMPRPNQDEGLPIKILASFQTSGELKGKWSIESAGAEGDWTAKPQKPKFKLEGIWDVVAAILAWAAGGWSLPGDESGD